MASERKGVAIGIDLGTTYSCVSVWTGSKAESIANEHGMFTTPSFVAFSGDERFVGEAACNQAARNAANTVFDAKRIIGRNFSDAAVAEQLPHLPFAVSEGTDGLCRIGVDFRGERKLLSPQEISAAVLESMVRTAETFLDQPVTGAVITVPAYFNDSQRNATKDAAAIANLNVLRLVNEPTAAALAYGLDKTDVDNRLVLVFDLGGGTFDVSVLRFDAGIFKVLSTAGDTRLGGQDFDARLVEHCAANFQATSGVDVRKDARAMRRLRVACERAKRTLSSSSFVDIEVENFSDGRDFFLRVTRARLEELCDGLFARCLDAVRLALKDSGVKAKSIHDIVMVGGSTRIPRVQQLVSDFFGGRDLKRTINPDEAVSHGAAIQAAILSNEHSENLDRIVLVDVVPLSLGLETAGGVMETIIPRNHTIPIVKEQTFTTHTDDQSAVSLQVFEGERSQTKDNHLLGEFTLDGISPARRGEPKIRVRFSVCENGILTVSAENSSSGKTEKLRIENDGGRLSEADIKRMISDAEAYRLEDRVAKKKAGVASRLESLLFKSKRSVGLSVDGGEDGELQRNVRSEILDVVEATFDWLAANRETVSLSDLESRFLSCQNQLHGLFAAEREPSSRSREGGDAGDAKRRKVDGRDG